MTESAPGVGHSPTSLSRRQRAVRALGWILGAPLCVWMLLWGMLWSALVGVVLLVPFRRRWLGFLLLPLFIWNVSLREFSAGMNVLVEAPELNARQRAAVSGLNLYMAVFGYPLFPEVAQETLWLTRGHTDVSGLSKAKRRARCKGSLKVPVIRRQSDFILRDAMARKAAKRAWKTRIPQRLRWDSYEKADSKRVALALWVPDARVTRKGDQLVASGTIQYPSSAGMFWSVPTLFGRVKVGLDEGIFCKMQAQGDWNPYRVEWVFDGPP